LERRALLGVFWKKPLLRAEQCSAFRFCKRLNLFMNYKTLKNVVLMIGCVLGAESVFIAPQASAQTNLLPIRIGYQSTPNWLLLVAKNMNLFEKAGLAPTFTKFTAGITMIPAAQNDEIDLGDVGDVPFLMGLSQGVDWVMIGISDEGAYTEGLVARKNSGIKSFADLKGKRIGYFKGSTAHFGLVMALRQTGVRAEQVEFVPLTPAEQLAALITNRIDAAMTWEPWMQNMVHEADAKIITTEGDLGIYTNVDGYAVRRAWLLAHRETAVRFLRALRMAFDLVQKDRAIAISTVAREMNIKEAWLKIIYQDDPPPNLAWWSDHAYQYSLVEGAAFHRRLGYLATFLFEEKIIAKELDVSEALDVSVITDAMKSSEDAAAPPKKPDAP
jgi:aliphatic sulfonates family ABC transporter substrate-binding protein